LLIAFAHYKSYRMLYAQRRAAVPAGQPAAVPAMQQADDVQTVQTQLQQFVLHWLETEVQQLWMQAPTAAQPNGDSPAPIERALQQLEQAQNRIERVSGYFAAPADSAGQTPMIERYQGLIEENRERLKVARRVQLKSIRTTRQCRDKIIELQEIARRNPLEMVTFFTHDNIENQDLDEVTVEAALRTARRRLRNYWKREIDELEKEVKEALGPPRNESKIAEIRQRLADYRNVLPGWKDKNLFGTANLRYKGFEEQLDKIRDAF